MTFLLLVTWVPAIVLLIVQIAVRRQLHVPPEQRLPVPGDHAVRVHRGRDGRRRRCWRCRRCRTSSRYVGILYAALIFFTQARLRRAARSSPAAPRSRGCRSRHNLAQVGDVIFRLPLRYDTPWPVSLLMIVAARSPLSGVDPRAARPRRRGGRVTARRRGRRRRSPVEVVRPGHRPERRHAHRAARHHRPARAERRRQVDVHEADHRPAQAEQGRRSRCSASRSGATRRSTSASASVPSRTRSTSG